MLKLALLCKAKAYDVGDSYFGGMTAFLRKVTAYYVGDLASLNLRFYLAECQNRKTTDY